MEINKKNDQKNQQDSLPSLVRERLDKGWKVLLKTESSITLKRGQDRLLFDIKKAEVIKEWSLSDAISFNSSLSSENSGSC